MRRPAILRAAFLCAAPASAQERTLDWVKVTAKAGWQLRDSSGEVVFKDQLWLMGGWFDSFHAPPRDVWYSRDGKEWTRLQSKVIWKERHEHSAYVFKDRICIAGGHSQPLSSEVWSLQVPKDWFKDK